MIYAYSEINVSKERIANNNQNYDRYLQDLEDLNSRIQELEEEKTSKLEKKK